MGEGKPLYCALLWSQSLSISLLWQQLSAQGWWGHWQRAQWQLEPPECHCSLQSALHSSCTEVSVKLNSALNFTTLKGLFLSPPHHSLDSIVLETQGSSLPCSDQNDSKLCLFYYWDIYTDRSRDGKHALFFFFWIEVRFKCRFVTQKQQQT